MTGDLRAVLRAQLGGVIANDALAALAAAPGPLVTTVDTDPLGDDPVCPSCGAVRGRTESRIDRLGCVDVWHEGFGTCPVRVLAVTEDVLRERLRGCVMSYEVDAIVRAILGGDDDA